MSCSYPHCLTVFGKADMTENLALRRPTNQSSTFGAFDSSKAVDGNSDGVLAHGSCSRTAKPNPVFWQVDLQGVYDIGEVVVHLLGEMYRE